MIELTLFERDAPPISVNEAHVISVRPRKDVRPVDATQNPSTMFVFKGAVLELTTGTRLSVVEDYPEVLDRLGSPSQLSSQEPATL